MKKQVLLLLTIVLTSCSGAAEANVLTEQEASFSFSSRSAQELVPYMQEVLAEMNDDYRNAVSLHDATRNSPAYGRQFLLVDKYIDFLLPAIQEVELVLQSAQDNQLETESYAHYNDLVSKWREKSTTVFGAVGRSL